MSVEFDKIELIFKQSHNKDISAYDRSFLEKILYKRLSALGITEYDDYCICLKNDPEEAHLFFDLLHINYSNFFRDPLTFAILEQNVLPTIITSKSNGGEIRLWSAGCSYGQEAYSLAMLLQDLIENCGRVIRYRIFATDNCSQVINFAKEGRYDKSAVANIKKKYLDKYFSVDNKSYSINDGLKRNINFSLYDMLDESTIYPSESIFGDFDIVICSNLMIYYKYASQKLIIKKLHHSMSATGYLVIGDSERNLAEKFKGLQSLNMQNVVFMKKQQGSEFL